MHASPPSIGPRGAQAPGVSAARVEGEVEAGLAVRLRVRGVASEWTTVEHVASLQHWYRLGHTLACKIAGVFARVAPVPDDARLDSEASGRDAGGPPRQARLVRADSCLTARHARDGLRAACPCAGSPGCSTTETSRASGTRALASSARRPWSPRRYERSQKRTSPANHAAMTAAPRPGRGRRSSSPEWAAPDEGSLHMRV